MVLKCLTNFGNRKPMSLKWSSAFETMETISMKYRISSKTVLVLEVKISAKVMFMDDEDIRGYNEVFFKNRNYIVLANLY